MGRSVATDPGVRARLTKQEKDTMRTARMPLMHDHDRARLADELEPISRYQQACTLGATQ
jgi:hypothetical protein